MIPRNKPKNVQTKNILNLLGADFSIGTETGFIIVKIGVSSLT